MFLPIIILKRWYFVQRLHALQEQLAASVQAQQNERNQELCQTPVRKKQQTGVKTKRAKRLKETESQQQKLKKIQ